MIPLYGVKPTNPCSSKPSHMGSFLQGVCTVDRCFGAIVALGSGFGSGGAVGPDSCLALGLVLESRDYGHRDPPR
jgi:hypothetical protein